MFAQEAELLLDEGTDARAPGGAVTVALCGHWDHLPPCRWPHNNTMETEGRQGRLRTVFAVIPEDEPVVRRRIEQGLRAGVGWAVVAVRAVELTDDERELGRRLLLNQ